MRALDDLSLKLKLGLLTGLCLLLLLASSGLTLWGSARLGSALQSVYSERLPSYAFAAHLETDIRDLNGLVNQSIALEAIGFTEKEIAAVDRSVAVVGDRIGKSLEERLPIAGPEEKELLLAVARSYKIYRKALADTMELKSTGLATASTFLTTAYAEYPVLLKAVTAITAKELQLAGSDVAQAQASSQRIQLLTLVAAAAAVVAGLIVSAAIAGGMLRRMRRLSEAMTALGDGDLTRSVVPEGRDEIGTLMKDSEAVRKRLAESMHNVRTASESVRVAAGEIASGNTSLGHRTESASAALQQTSASMHQLTGAVDENARACERAADTASGAAVAARASGQVVAQVVQTMGDISQSSRRIAEITGVIDGIAFQTNILALNAAVEAARAGEQGRGFAVVAGEVRNLAQRASQAAKEIAGLIQASASSVNAGSDLVNKAGGSIDKLVGEVAAVADLLTGIRAATLQQSSEIQQINTALSSIDSATLQNAALVEESTAASQSLRAQSDSLSEILGRFRVAA
jgi:methyl-accepting chemotaxis protein